MAKSNRSKSAVKPQKPYLGSPLTPHPLGHLCKRIRGKLHYFGKVPEPDAALKRFNREWPFLQDGRTPPPVDTGDDWLSGSQTVIVTPAVEFSRRITWLSTFELSRGQCRIVRINRMIGSVCHGLLRPEVDRAREQIDPLHCVTYDCWPLRITCRGIFAEYRPIFTMTLELKAGADSSATILVVDDEAPVRNLLATWLTSRGYRSVRADSAAAARHCLETESIDLITADINMPGGSGIDLLRHVVETQPDLPVLMLTGNKDTGSAIAALNAGAFGYLLKPARQDELLAQVGHGLELRRLRIERRRYTEGLEQRVREQTVEIRQAHEETIHRLVHAAACRDLETGAHIVRTGAFSEILARAAGWSAAEVERIRMAAPMHDIGKIGVPDAILRKPAGLTADEYAVMKQHTVIGAKLLARSNSAILIMAREIALCHHERWDGKGYPAGTASDAIPEAARILSIVDVYDALTSDRPYRRALKEEEVLKMMMAEQGRQFDPVLLTTFFSVLEEIRQAASDHPDDAENTDGYLDLTVCSVPFATA
jgi:putative two-component system response regulator